MQFSADERLIPGHEGDQRILRQHLARYEFASTFVKGKRVLDVACGAGYGAALLKEAGAASVRGIDISSDAIAHAQRHYSSLGIDFAVGRGEDLPHDGMVDVVTSFETIEHVSDAEKFLCSISAAIDTQGMLIISTPVRAQGTLETPPANRFHVREWNREEFETLLRKFFPHISMSGQFEIVKLSFPGSRTLRSAILRVLSPGSYRILRRYSVSPTPPPVPLFPTAMAYMVAVCTR